jgi:predicted molibdopterin-dependent oxidoreductase YjgC
MKIILNNKETEALPGETLIETARREGYAIPSLCYAKNARHKPSCMICAVKNCTTGQIIPACTTAPTEGMQIETDSPEIRSSRTISLELLLSDHRADCEAPCSIACPANMDVAAMNRLHDEGRNDEALALLRDTLVIPATLCFICNAPCEKVCRKGNVNKPVPVREIKKRLVLQTDLTTVVPPTFRNGKTIAVVGSNPAALAAACHLCKRGYAVTVFEPSGQILVPYIQAENVPDDILKIEIEVIKRMGIVFKYTSEQPSHGDFDAIVPPTKSKQPARMTLEGRRLADEIHASLSTGRRSTSNEIKDFNSTYQRFTDVEKQLLDKPSSAKTGCLYCDCNGKTTCSLRRYATEYGVKNIRYTKESVTEALRRRKIGDKIIFEPAKCIKCGLCVYNTDNGFTFKGRGFAMQVTIPDENENNVNEQIIELCPTAALSCI